MRRSREGASRAAACVRTANPEVSPSLLHLRRASATNGGGECRSGGSLCRSTEKICVVIYFLFRPLALQPINRSQPTIVHRWASTGGRRLVARAHLRAEGELPIQQGEAAAPDTIGVDPSPHGVLRWPKIGGEQRHCGGVLVSARCLWLEVEERNKRAVVGRSKITVDGPIFFFFGALQEPGGLRQSQFLRLPRDDPLTPRVTPSRALGRETLASLIADFRCSAIRPQNHSTLVYPT
jgi:hypothetical protein